jgi:hypothetical protein
LRHCGVQVVKPATVGQDLAVFEVIPGELHPLGSARSSGGGVGAPHEGQFLPGESHRVVSIGGVNQ